MSVVGRKAPDFEVDSFDVSYGDPQTVAVDRQARAQAAAAQLQDQQRQDQDRPRRRSGRAASATATRTTTTTPSSAAQVKGTKRRRQGQGLVQRREAGQAAPRRRRVGRVHLHRQEDTGAKVLVIADEDHNGVNPTYPNPPGGGLQYGQAHLDAVRAAGYSADLWDTDTQGVPHDLGVLSHYKAVVWYMGDNRITQDQEDFFTDDAVRRPARHLGRRARAVPDDGRARLPQRGRQAHQRRRDRRSSPACPGITDVVGGLYYGLNGDARRRSASITTVAGPLRRLPAAGQRLPPVLPGRVHARQPDGGAERRRRRSRRRSTAITAGLARHADATRSTRRASSSRPATCCRSAEFPQFAQPGRRAVQLHRRPVHAGRGHATTRARCTQDHVVHAADARRST